MRVLLRQKGERKFDTAVGCGSPRSSTGRHPTVCCFAPSLSSLLPPSHSAVTWPVLERSFPLYFPPSGAASCRISSCLISLTIPCGDRYSPALFDASPIGKRSLAQRCGENEFSEKDPSPCRWNEARQARILHFNLCAA